MPTRIDVVIIAPRQRQLNVLLGADDTNRKRWTLPHADIRTRETLDDAAARVCRSVLPAQPQWIRQVRAIETGRLDPSVAVGYLAVCPEANDDSESGTAWVAVEDVGRLPAYQRTLVAKSVETLRASGDAAIAFAMLPPRFTLAELQRVNEMIGGRQLHKASFRRSLLAAKLVEPTDAYRVEGRGRPARVFRFAGR